MNKKYIIFILFFPVMLNAQTLSQEVIASTGGYFEGGSGKLSFSAGESFIETYKHQSCVLTQGFLQIENSSPVSVTNLQKKINIMIYPVPVKTMLKIDILDQEEGLTGIIYSLDGKVIKTCELNLVKNEIDMEKLPGGSYLLRINNDKGIIKESRIIIKN